MPLLQDSHVETSAPERRFLIASGTARYASLPEAEQLPSVALDLQRMVALFTDLGYEQALPELSRDPSSAALRLGLSDWLTHPDRRATDSVVFYYSGHGHYARDKHYLLTADSRLSNPVGTALRTRELGDMLDGTPLQRVLIILDTCYSGLGGVEITAVAQTLLDSLTLPDIPGTGFYILAAARSREVAEQNVFSLALDAVVRKPDPRYAGARQPYLGLDSIVEALNADFAANAPYQHARLNAANIESTSRFIPNPYYRPETLLQPGIDIETQQRILRRYAQERITHWGPQSRGVESEAQPGWYFTGRINALRELVAWLAAPQPDGKARVVTGDPGSGKSALLARLVTLSDPEYRRRAPLTDIPPDTLPPESAIQIALHARQKTLEELLAALAAETGIAETDPELFVAALAERGTALTLVVDALDEAADPTSLALRLLRPLTQVRCIKLLIGTRRPCIPSLGPAIVELDLDTPAYIERADIVEYIRRRLLAADDPDSRTPYRNLPELAAQVAAVVADRAFPVFLIARLISQELIQTQTPVNPQEAGWSRNLPESVGEAFGQYLARFGPNESRITDMLRPLAYAEGGGLPWESLWAPLASAVAGKPYSDSDIDWLLKHAGAYIVESLAGGRSVYRLYHQALAEYLRREGQEREVQRRFTDTLRDQTPALNANGDRDWLRAHPYIRTHLAAHAAQAGLLGDLTGDPLYLIAADPDRLLAALSLPDCHAGREETHLYEAAFHKVKRSHTKDEAASYLQMEARKAGMETIADAIEALPLKKRSWSVPWAHWQRESPHRTLLGHTDTVHSVALGAWQGRAIIASASADKTVRLWDLASGAPLGEPLQGHQSAVRSVALCAWQGRSLVVSGSDDGTVRVWDLASGAPYGEPLDGGDGSISSVALGEWQGRQVIVTGSSGNVLRLWDLENRTSLCAILQDGTRNGAILCVAIGEKQEQTILAAVGADGVIRLQDPAACAQVGASIPGSRGFVQSVALGEWQGKPILASGGDEDTVRVLDLASGLPLGEPGRGHTGTVNAVAFGKWQGRTILASGSWDGTVRLWDPGSGAPLGEPLQGHSNNVTSVALGKAQGKSVLVSGSWDKTVCIWDLDDIASPEASPPIRSPWINAVAAGELQGRPILASGGQDNQVHIWDAVTGAPVCAPLQGHTGAVYAVAFGERQGRKILASGSWDGTVRLWDPENGIPLGTPAEGRNGAVSALAFGERQGRLILASGNWDGTVRLWDPGSGASLGEPIQGHSAPVTAVALAAGPARTLLVSGSRDATVRILDLDAATPTARKLEGHTGAINAVALGERQGRRILASGSEDGTIRLWDPDSGAPIGEPIREHSGWVTSVALGKELGRIVLVSGGNDYTVRVWDLNGRLLQAIDVGTYVYAVTILPDRQIAVGTRKGLIALKLLEL